MKMFNMIGIDERTGSGVPDIYAVWDTQGWVSPKVEEQFDPDRTILTLSFIDKQAETNKRQKQLKISDELLNISQSKEAAKQWT